MLASFQCSHGMMGPLWADTRCNPCRASYLQLGQLEYCMHSNLGTDTGVTRFVVWRLVMLWSQHAKVRVPSNGYLLCTQGSGEGPAEVQRNRQRTQDVCEGGVRPRSLSPSSEGRQAASEPAESDVTVRICRVFWF